MPIEEPSDEKPKTVVGVTPVLDTKSRFFMGKDYSNSYEKDFEFIDKFDEGLILILKNPNEYFLLKIISIENLLRECHGMMKH
jgi:hypothetical protein